METSQAHVSLDAPIEIEISNLAGPLCSITAKSGWSVYNLKEGVTAATGINPANQKLVYDGECLLGQSKLHEILPMTGAEIMLIRVQDQFVRLKYPYGCDAADLLVETMTVEEAKDRCASLGNCIGFVFNGASALEDTSECVEVHFKKMSERPIAHRANGVAIDTSSCTFLHIGDENMRTLLVNYLSDASHREAISAVQSRELIEDLVRRNFFAFSYVCQGLRDDPEIVMAAVMQNPQVLQYASATQRNNKELILAAVSKSGLALQHATPAMQAEREVVCTAVEENPDAFRFASIELQNDKAIVMIVVQGRGMMLRDMSPTFSSDREVVLAAIRQNGAALTYASEDLRNDEDLKNEAKQQKLRSKFK